MDATTEFWRDVAMPYAESRRACGSRACYKPHSHPTYSIGAVDQGHSVFASEGENPVILEPGALILVPARRVHSCNPRTGAAWSYQMLHLDTDWVAEVRLEYRAPAAHLLSEPVRLLHSPQLYAKFCEVNAVLFSTVDAQEKEAALIEFIGDCDGTPGTDIADPAWTSPSVSRVLPVLDMLRQSPAANISLDLLARSAGMSRYQLIRSFRSATGLTPHAWQLNRKVNLARELILAGETSAHVAHTLGFADQAHFQRVFKAYTGVTPGRFRA